MASASIPTNQTTAADATAVRLSVDPPPKENRIASGAAKVTSYV